jgi:hypothetical protein
VWRAMLPGGDLSELSTTLAGRPSSGLVLCSGVRKTSYTHSGRATDVHQVRAIWANEFFKQTGDFAAAAEELGSNS